MKIEKWYERMESIEAQMKETKQFSPEWSALDTERQKVAVKISDIKRKQKHDERFLKAEKRKSIIHKMKHLERFSPEWTALSNELLSMV